MPNLPIDVLRELLPQITAQFEQIAEAIRLRIDTPITFTTDGPDWSVVIEVQPKGQKPNGAPFALKN